MKARNILMTAAGLFMFAASCVNDPEKHTESESDPMGKDTDTTTLYQEIR